MKKFSNVMEIKDFLSDIEFGWSDIDNNLSREPEKGFKKNYVLSSPEETLKNKMGTDFDLVEVERSCFKSLGIKFDTYFMAYYESRRMFTHTFVVYEENEKFYWFEASWENDKGIHEYSSLYDLLTSVREKLKKYKNIKFMDNDYLCVYKYRKPKYHMNLKDLYKHCESGENVLI